MAGNLTPPIRFREFDANGNPLAGGKLYTYQAGTSTPQATYTSSTLGTPNANPVVLDSAGRAAIWLDPSLSYKFVLKDSSDVQIYSEDNVIGLITNDSVGTNSLQALCVTTAKMALNSVDSTILKSDASVDANRAVQTNHIRDLNVTRGKLAVGAIAAENVTASKTANYTATTSDDVIPCSASGAAFTVALYAASGNSGRRITIKKTDSSFNAVTIDANASETIDGALTTALSTQNESVTLVCDGSNWFIEARRIPSELTSYSCSITGVTSNPTTGTLARNEARWRRVGDSIEIQYTLKQTSVGTAGSGIYLWSLPTGLTIDTAKLSVEGAAPSRAEGSVSGPGEVGDGTNAGVGFMYPYDSTHLSLTILTDTIPRTSINSGFFALNSATITYSFKATVPITGWNG